jgi:hypothetical protein
MRRISQGLLLKSLLTISAFAQTDTRDFSRPEKLCAGFSSDSRPDLPRSKRKLRHLACLLKSSFTEFPSYFRGETLVPTDPENFLQASVADFEALTWGEARSVARALNGEAMVSWTDAVFPERRMIQNAKFLRKMRNSVQVHKDPELGRIGDAAVSLYFWAAVERCRIDFGNFDECEKMMKAVFNILEIRKPRTTGALLHFSVWETLLRDEGLKDREALRKLAASFEKDALDDEDLFASENLWSRTLAASDGNRSRALRLLGVYLGLNNTLDQFEFPLRQWVGTSGFLELEELKTLLLDLEFLDDLLPLLASDGYSRELGAFLYPKNYRAPNERYYHFYHRAYLSDQLSLMGFDKVGAVHATFAFGYAYEALSDLSRYASDESLRNGEYKGHLLDLFLSGQGALFGSALPGYQHNSWLLKDGIPWQALRDLVTRLPFKKVP